MSFYKRSIFLINPAFQLRLSFVICSLVFVSSLIYPLILFDFFNELAGLAPELEANFMGAKNNFIIFVVVIQTLFTVMVFILSLFITHKIAGPMFKLKYHLASIRGGEPITPITFRSGDHFQDVAEEVSLFLETVLMNQENDFNYLDEVSVYIENIAHVVPDDKKPILNEISRRLIDIKTRYKRPL